MGSIRIPNFPAFCSQDFDLRCNNHCHSVSLSSEKWALSNPLFLDAEEEARLPGARLGLLAALCFPACDAGQLLAITKWLIVLVHWTDRPRSLYADLEIFDPIWTRCFRPSTRRDWQKRFQRHLAAFQLGQAVTARDTAQGIVPDFESYNATRKDACGVRMLLDLVVYADGLNIPQQVYEQPMLRRMRQNAADIIAWATDIAAYAQHPDPGNLVTVVMHERRYTAQGAVCYAGNLVKETVCHFLENEALLPEFGDWEEEVQAYVRGLRNCIVGCLHWLYETDRFFGETGEDVRSSGWVFVS